MIVLPQNPGKKKSRQKLTGTTANANLMRANYTVCISIILYIYIYFFSIDKYYIQYFE